ncbi:serine hydrolase domain-containing protein [Mangrovimicrobium sediminis]|uniref:serine hydrolase domain-containing protein n=1 Tax=Mangrovimicrobium sediminis TaxID=2562682 RepID=UPI001F0D9873|nr:beta-lactamase family protein [Haliea sp. SAOS-164]
MSINRILKSTFLALTVGLAQPALARDDISAQLDAIFEAIPPGAPGCNVGVVERGVLIHKRGYGLANLELDVPLSGDEVHRMASVSKQFTAMAVLLLVQDGKIDLDADIHRYLPELPDYGARVTVNAMLGHFSGMGDYDLIGSSYEGPRSRKAVDLSSAAGGEFRLGNEDYLTISEFYDVVKTVPLALTPERKFRYSNLAYFLLSMLVEEVSGESLRAFAERRIFKPLGMNSTFFADQPTEIVKHRAYGYKRNRDGVFVNDMTNLFWVGDGGLHTNLEDMLKWDRNFYQPQVGPKPAELIAMMNRPNSDHRTRKWRYANGQFVGESRGLLAYTHDGGWLGTSTFYRRYPAVETSLIVLCNDAGADGRLIARALDVVMQDAH